MELLSIRRKSPLVSILVVSHNGWQDVQCLIFSILGQSYTNYEILIAENGSQSSFFSLKSSIELSIASAGVFLIENRGFADANNYLAGKARGDYLLLVNPDATLERDALEILVTSLERDKSSVAACPITYFYGRFLRLQIQDLIGDSLLGFDISRMVSDMYYRKVFIREGYESETGIACPDIVSDKLILDIPLGFSPQAVIQLFPILANGLTCSSDSISIDIIGAGQVQHWSVENDVISLHLGSQELSASFKIINNAGSYLLPGGAGDKRYGEQEDYSIASLEHVDAFCGVCVLLRKSILVARNIFNPVFFAYYEDSELSHWIKNTLKANILFNPLAKVFHKHSESTVERSPLWRLLVQRSNLYYVLITEGSNKILKFSEQLNQLYIEYESSTQSFKSDILDTLKKLDIEYQRTCQLTGIKLRVGIFNAHMSSMGGGEKHALSIAATLSSDFDCEVYIASESDFDLDNAVNYFDIKHQNVKKYISSEFAGWETALFDIFINASFGSRLIPVSRKNYYIVSFPDPMTSKDVIKSLYHYLHNSHFTCDWATRYWGTHRSSLLYPVIGLTKRCVAEPKNKKKNIIAIGRFNWQGHCKNQHLIIDAFKKCKIDKLTGSDWRLIIAGSVDEKSEDSVSHFKSALSRASQREDIEIYANVDHAVLSQLLDQAAMYIHATGLTKDQMNEPHLHEHYGITVVEALTHGCYPVVYEHGGPSEIVRECNLDFKNNIFTSAKSLISAISKSTCFLGPLIEGEQWESFKIIQRQAMDYISEKEKQNTQVLSGIVLRNPKEI
jgi:GT2 family glycosyltransferase